MFVTVHEMPYAHSSTAQHTLTVTVLPPNVRQLRDENCVSGRLSGELPALAK